MKPMSRQKGRASCGRTSVTIQPAMNSTVMNLIISMPHILGGQQEIMSHAASCYEHACQQRLSASAHKSHKSRDQCFLQRGVKAIKAETSVFCKGR